MKDLNYEICKEIALKYKRKIDIFYPIVYKNYYNKSEYKLQYQELCLNLKSRSEFKNAHPTEY